MSERNWGAERGRAPTVADGDTIVIDEFGRVLDNVCYRSHWFRIVRHQYGGYSLLVKHGAGEETHALRYQQRAVSAILKMDSDDRYMLMHTLYQVAKNSQRMAEERTAHEYRTAFVEGRLKKRKLPSRGIYNVWIERQPLIKEAIKL